MQYSRRVTECDAGPSPFSISDKNHVPRPGRTAEEIFNSTQDYAELSFLSFLSFFFLSFIFF